MVSTNIHSGEASSYQRCGKSTQFEVLPGKSLGKENHQSFHSSLKSYPCDLTKHVRFCKFSSGVRCLFYKPNKKNQ